ncbi:2-polyprenyl-6-methoxyphenol hydroxylase-like FAD-dependent oxidoreductase [Pedobacter cryoconitis]|uniref:2-polyprenyl-6-methoxyphenol hydroxylase-like FAD-dependent oxidoreductase n=1 Tax=Pedobacter cryoconitis TaxID=188932 RepID=A0A7W8ZN30_9SPHI|nr:FAD-dependent monooxygenase [Pedobacter cryoconitis]MBB5636885.1 2-polyprenyl-6-methoxyphenol hydroxylase-like FAD-dependent oxidoreductase [Pedobacter cryoconitis]
MNINEDQPEVAIIGAGLGGLCLAQGLKKRGIPFHIFEKDISAASRSQGYRIRIDQTGQDALKKCLPEKLFTLFKNTCVPSIQINTLTPQLKPLKKWIESWKDEKAALPDLKANRTTMREILLQGLTENIHFNKEFESYQKHENGKVTLNFADGTNYSAKVVVAADGINSKLTRQRFPDNHLLDTGSVCLYGKTYFTDAVKKQTPGLLQTGTTVIFDEELAVISDAMLFNQGAFQETESSLNLSPVQDYIYWAFIGNRSRFGLRNHHHLRFSTTEFMPVIKSVTTKWNKDLKALFEHSATETLTIVPVRTSFPKAGWATDQITALGDAIHAMSPAGGLGANTALYDAAVLTEQLAGAVNQQTDIIRAIAAYEYQMCKHSFEAVNISGQGSTKLYSSSVNQPAE